MNNIKAILFDIDGTLISIEPAVKSIQEICEKKGYRIPSEKEIKEKIISKPLAKAIRTIIKMTEEEGERFYQAHHENLSKNHEPKLLKNSKETLTYFKKKRIQNRVSDHKKKKISRKSN